MLEGARNMADIDLIAGDWLQRHQAGSLTSSDEKELEAWLAADVRHARAYASLSDMSSALRGMPGLARFDEEFDKAVPVSLWQRLGPALFPAKPVWALAMMAVLVAGASWFLFRPYGGDITAAYSTNVAETRDIALADGSILSLGAKSTAKVRFSGGERTVHLQEGEAFFSVAKEAGRPFTVKVDEAEVKVLGTRFNVHKGITGVRVAVLDGSVQVSSITGQAAPILKAGEQAMAVKSGPIQVSSVSAQRAGAWRSGRLVYDDAALVDVIADANRYYHKQIVLASQELGDMRVSASFSTDQIDQMIYSLAGGLELEVHSGSADTLILLPVKKDG